MTMTEKEAQAILKNMRYELSNQVASTYCKKKYEAVGMAIEALEKEPKAGVLDKIKAEIIDKSYLSYDNNPRHIIDESWVLEIIDKIQTGG